MVIYVNSREVIVLKNDNYLNLYIDRDLDEYDRYEVDTDVAITFMPTVDFVNHPFN